MLTFCNYALGTCMVLSGILLSVDVLIGLARTGTA